MKCLWPSYCLFYCFSLSFYNHTLMNFIFVILGHLTASKIIMFGIRCDFVLAFPSVDCNKFVVFFAIFFYRFLWMCFFPFLFKKKLLCSRFGPFTLLICENKRKNQNHNNNSERGKRKLIEKEEENKCL